MKLQGTDKKASALAILEERNICMFYLFLMRSLTKPIPGQAKYGVSVRAPEFSFHPLIVPLQAGFCQDTSLVMMVLQKHTDPGQCIGGNCCHQLFNGNN